MGAVLRGLIFVVAGITLIAFVPASITSDWPEEAQQAVALAGTVQGQLSDGTQAALGTSADWLTQDGRDLLGQAVELLLEWLEHVLEIDLSGLIADLRRLLPDLDILLGDLLGDWWPWPRLPAGGGDLPRVAATFSAAKELLYERIYRGHRLTAYCGCRYSGRGRIDLASCGLERYGREKRAHRVEAEHVFPAAQFGNFRRCWRQPEAYRACRGKDGETLSGRKCCLRVDDTFLVAHNDLQNLIPAVGLINGDRRDYRWGMAPDGVGYGRCAIRIDASQRRAQPPAALQGDIARIMLYMRDTYGFRLSPQDERLYRTWNNQDPVDAWELKRQKRISRLQGMENSYVVAYRAL